MRLTDPLATIAFFIRLHEFREPLRARFTAPEVALYVEAWIRAEARRLSHASRAA